MARMMPSEDAPIGHRPHVVSFAGLAAGGVMAVITADINDHPHRSTTAQPTNDAVMSAASIAMTR